MRARTRSAGLSGFLAPIAMHLARSLPDLEAAASGLSGAKVFSHRDSGLIVSRFDVLGGEDVIVPAL